MPFSTLTEAQIVSNAINTYTSLITTPDDVNPGSNIRSIFEAFAQELKLLYSYVNESAAETQKMAAYSMFGFSLLPAQAAYTMVTFTAQQAPSSAVTVPAGTTVAVPGTNIQYMTPADMTWPAGSASVSLRVQCTQTGSIGNQRAGAISQLVTSISGLTNITVTNPKDVRTGADLETEDQRKNRFQQWINSLHRGDNRAILYGAKQAMLIDEYGYISEQVMKAQLVEGNGSNTLYIDNGYYDTSTDLVTQCQQVINGYTDSTGTIQPGYKAAGLPTTVQPATVQQVSVSINASPKPGYTFAMIQQSIADAVSNLGQSLDVGNTLTMALLNLTIGKTPGVMNYQITTPTADVVPASGTILQLSISVASM